MKNQSVTERAAKRGQISAIKGTRKAGDPPTVHH
jgi:hypothetical protein